MRTLLALTLVTLLSGSTLAAEPPVVHHGDVVRVTIPVDGLAALSFDGLEGTALTVKARSRTSGLSPQIVLLDPDEVEIRRATGSLKAKIRGFALPQTGRYLVIVRGEDRAPGLIEVKVRAKHPVRLVTQGTVSTSYEVDTVRFPAFAGTEAGIKVKGKSGFEPSADTVLTPGVGEAALDAVVVRPGYLRRDGFPCETMDDYRLLIHAGNGTYGNWKCKVKLSHPVEEGRDLEVVGITEEEAPDQEIPVPPEEEPDPEPEPEPEFGPYNLLDVTQTSTFRVTLQFVDPPPNAAQWHIRYLSQTLRLRVRIDNISSTSQTITWFSPPQAFFAFKHENGKYYGAKPAIDWQGTISYPPGPVLDFTDTHPPGYFSYYGFPPGRYEITVFFPGAGSGAGIPASPTLRFLFK